MSGLLSRLAVTWQIGLVALLGVVGLIAVGLFYWTGSQRLAVAEAALDRSYAGLDKLAAINADLLQARRSEKDLLLRRKDEYVQKQGAAIAAFERDATELAALIDERERSALTAVGTAVET